MACQQASGQDISDGIDDDDIFQLSGIQMEGDGDGKMTGKFRSKHRPTEIIRPGEDWVTTRTNKMDMGWTLGQLTELAKRSSRA